MAHKETEEEKVAREMIEEIANNIRKLAKEVRAIVGGSLKEEAVVTLLVHATKMPIYQVEKVIKALKELDRTTLK